MGCVRIRRETRRNEEFSKGRKELWRYDRGSKAGVDVGSEWRERVIGG